jgi:phosphoglycerate dehydrogenase-like enzyme
LIQKTGPRNRIFAKNPISFFFDYPLSMKSIHVLLLNTPAPQALETLHTHLSPGIHLITGPNLPDLAEYEILVTGRPTREALLASPALNTLVIPFAGLPAVTRDLLREFPHIAVHNLHHNAALTAEMAITLLLAAAKFIIPADRALRQSNWRPRYEPSPAVLLNNKTALVLGFGQVGQRIGCVCHALGMRILATRRDLSKPVALDYPVEIHPPDDLAELLPKADVLLISLPDTQETEGLIGEHELALLPQGAVLVNVGRGPIIEQAALYHALRSNHLRAAGLDVWYRYPQSEAEWNSTPPADFPFHELDNVVLSPHRAGQSSETETLRMIALAELLNCATQGLSLPNKVNLEAGY